MDIVWYPAKDDAPWLPFPSGVVSLDWDRQEMELGVYADKPTGEVANRPRTYNGQTAKPAATGLHQCGTKEMFADGAAFSASVNRPKRPDGLPGCCGMLAAGVVVGSGAQGFLGRGAVEIGGHSVVLKCGVFVGGGDIYDPTTMPPAVGYESDPGFSADTMFVQPITALATYRFKLWADNTLFSVRVGGGGTFGGGSWFHDFSSPSAGYFEWTQTIPASFIHSAYWQIGKNDTGTHGYIVSVEKL